MKSSNSRRARLSEARCFGAEAVAIRSMRCLVAVAADETGQPHQQLLEHGWLPCLGITQATHVRARGRGGSFGGRFDLAPLCGAHHIQSGEAGTSARRKFEILYTLDLRAIADALAFENPSPLGIVGLADRWAWHWLLDDGHAMTNDPPGPRLEGYDVAALMDWSRRRMAADAGAFDEDNIQFGCAQELAVQFEGHYMRYKALAYALCEEAGWPS